MPKNRICTKNTEIPSLIFEAFIENLKKTDIPSDRVKKIESLLLKEKKYDEDSVRKILFD
jgi:hypothetical protein